MVRQLLLCAGVAVSLSAVAADNMKAQKAQVATAKAENAFVLTNANRAVAKMNDGSNTPSKASFSKNVQWKRPAGQFWGNGYDATINQMGYYFTPLVLRPWVDYTLENMSTAKGTPTWTISSWSNQLGDYVEETSSDENVTVSYLRYETADIPYLAYKNLAYPIQYYGADPTGYAINILADENMSTVFSGDVMTVSSHYWGLFSRNSSDRSGFLFYTGADVYPGMDEDYGCWFGTNNSGMNAMATRFEKPDQPYLLNGVYWYYQFGQDIPNDIPMKAYVFKTANDAEEYETSSGNVIEGLSLGELIATSESFVPAAISDDDTFDGAVEFKFVEKNPVTGAENVVSLEIEDDITIVVTGFNAELSNGGYITTFLSTDEFDEGYGNLGFLGQFEEGEDGTISYWMPALKNFFTSALPNTTLGVLADVSYPWVVPAELYEQPSSVKFANEGATYQLDLMSTSETDDYEITYNGEDESDWLSIIDVADFTEVDEETGEEVYSGYNALLFEAAPNPNDEARVCTVKVTIPAASYEIVFLQGSGAEAPDAVEVVKVEGEAQYFDLAGRRVVNPEKGVYVKVSGNKAEKVVL